MRTRQPLPLLVAAAVAAVLLGLPVLGLLVRVPWSVVPDALGNRAIQDALRLSLLCATSATAVSVVVGVPLAWVLAHAAPRVRRVLHLLVTVPLVLPPVVGGVALLMTFGRHGLVGSWLPVSLPFTTAGVVLAEAFVAMPFLVLSVEAALRAQDGRLQEAAATLGLGPLQRFWHVDLPGAGTGLLAGACLCWARALGEFGATITFAGSLQGTTRTLPLATYLALETSVDQALVLSLVLLVVCALVLLLLRDRWLPQVRS